MPRHANKIVKEWKSHKNHSWKWPQTEELNNSIWEPENVSSSNVEDDWYLESNSNESESIARCRVVRFEGEEAICEVHIDGFELPKVSFPSRVIKQKNLEVDGRFHWIMRDGSKIRTADIDVDVPQSDEFTEKENAGLDDLYKEFQKALQEDGGEWPEFTGPGR